VKTINNYNLDCTFKPKSIAVIGASTKPGRVGYEIVKNLINGGFHGRLYPVNPKGGEISGYKVYKDISEVDDEVDLALIALPAEKAVNIIDKVGTKGVKSVVVFSSGFSEIGNLELEKQLYRKCREYGIRVIGPNCAGIIYWGSNLYASFVPGVKKGDLALISQSGALTAVLVDYLNWKDIGLSLLVSYGNRIDVNEIDIMTYFRDDESIKAFMIYLEGFRKGEGRIFTEAVKDILRFKPIVVLKAGRGTAGERAVKSHTGALAGDYKLYSDILSSMGVALVDEYYELVDVAEALSVLPQPKSDNIVIITNSGGPAAILADFISYFGLKLPELPSALKEKLSFLPSYMGRTNPIDLTASGLSDIYYETLRVVLKDEWPGCILTIHVPPSFVNPVEIASAVRDAYLDSKVEKPLIPLFLGLRREQAYKVLRLSGVFPTPFNHRSAALSVKWLYRYWRARLRLS